MLYYVWEVGEDSFRIPGFFTWREVSFTVPRNMGECGLGGKMKSSILEAFLVRGTNGWMNLKLG